MAAAGSIGNENLVVPRRAVNWGAIWAGVFTFWAIWTVFGMLGIGVFTSAASAHAAQSFAGMNVGESIWLIVLTAIAMYVAGLVTGRLSAVTTRQEGAAHGQAMFGVGVAGVILFLILASLGTTTTLTAASAHSPYVIGLLSEIGWASFVALFLGWIGAMIGGSQGQRQRTGTGTSGTERPVQQIRNVA